MSADERARGRAYCSVPVDAALDVRHRLRVVRKAPHPAAKQARWLRNLAEKAERQLCDPETDDVKRGPIAMRVQRAYRAMVGFEEERDVEGRRFGLVVALETARHTYENKQGFLKGARGRPMTTEELLDTAVSTLRMQLEGHLGTEPRASVAVLKAAVVAWGKRGRNRWPAVRELATLVGCDAPNESAFAQAIARTIKTIRVAPQS